MKSGLVDGKELAADGTYLPANVSRDSWIETEVEAELSMQSYLIVWMKSFRNNLVSKSRQLKRLKSIVQPVKQILIVDA